MSYNVTISRNNISSKDEKAWIELDNLLEREDLTSKQGQDFLNLIEKLKSKFPCICDLADDKVDDGVWSDGPLSNNAGKDLTTLGVVFSQVETVIPFLINTANENGFIVFDPQTGIISRPKKKSLIMNLEKEEIKSVKKGLKLFWKKLFGN